MLRGIRSARRERPTPKRRGLSRGNTAEMQKRRFFNPLTGEAGIWKPPERRRRERVSLAPIHSPAQDQPFAEPLRRNVRSLEYAGVDYGRRWFYRVRRVATYYRELRRSNPRSRQIDLRGQSRLARADRRQFPLFLHASRYLRSPGRSPDLIELPARCRDAFGRREPCGPLDRRPVGFHRNQCRRHLYDVGRGA